ncbi:MAG: hypothetical protein AAFP78_12600 [Pseudomonadota bacterium]
MFKDVDAFLADGNRALLRGDYRQFVDMMNVQESQKSAKETLVNFFENTFGNGGVRMSVLFRRDTGDEGLQMAAAVWKDETYSWISLTGHKRPDGFAIVHMGFESNLATLLNKYF